MTESEKTTKTAPTPQPAKEGKDHGVLYVGMDLGTSRTAISASNGVRECLFSVVGYPKDHVAQKLLNRSVLVGKEAIDKRLSLDFHRPLEPLLDALEPLSETFGPLPSQFRERSLQGNLDGLGDRLGREQPGDRPEHAILELKAGHDQ